MRLSGTVGWMLLGTLAVSPANAAAPADPGRPSASARHVGQNGDLTQQQVQLAQVAWRYFENNFQPETCLYNSVDGYASTTMWDTASSIAALVAAYELELIDAERFDSRLGCLLATLERLPMYQDLLPNKAYNTATLEEVDYGNNPGEIGVSAIDLGRLLIWLDIVKERYPAHADVVDRFVARWSFCDLVHPSGTLYGAAHQDDETVWLQEGRLGYEEYAAMGFQLWGFDTAAASRPDPYEELSIYGVPIAYDARDPKDFGAHNYVITEPYVLLGIELNWDLVGDTETNERRHSDKLNHDLAGRVYEAQVRRWKRTGTLTARTEHHVPGEPYFVYDTVFSDGVAWNTIGEDGHQHPELAALSTRAALGLDVLFDTRYTSRLVDAVTPLADRDKGLYEGMYESTGKRIDTLSANTNGIVLETLLYKKVGKLVRDGDVDTAWTAPIDAEGAAARCVPR